MNKVTNSALEIAVKESLKNFELKEDSSSLRDLFLYHDTEDNSLVIYDDAEHILNKVVLTDNQIFNLSYILRQIFQQARKERFFDKSYIAKPFTVSIVDKDFVVLEELFFLDDDAFKTHSTNWSNIEKDLDDFIEKLLR